MTERFDRPGVDLVLKLGERNTPRSCVANDCDHDADYYVLTDDVLSEYACEEHLEGTIERAQAWVCFLLRATKGIAVLHVRCRPPTPVAGPAKSATTERACDIELPEPPESTAGVALSATAVRDLVSDYSSHDESETEHSSFLDEPTSTEGLAPTQFGTAVHRLCELSLVGSTIDWSTTPAQIVDIPDRLSPTVIEDLQNHVQYGVSDIQQLEAKLPVQTTYDEYQVRLELPTGQVVGDIDHLTVTDDCYYISDYKTDTLRDQDLETVAEHYFVQLYVYVYACALSQADSTRDYVLRLIFTNAETTEEKTVSSDDINEWRERLTRALAQDSANERSSEQ